VLANIAAMLDMISAGRIEPGIGASWNEKESGPYRRIRIAHISYSIEHFSLAATVNTGRQPRARRPKPMPSTSPSASPEADIARRALEEVCSGRSEQGFDVVYHAEFVDHVNDSIYRGRAGARASVAGYRQLLGDGFGFRVEVQIVDGDRVCSRWTLTGTHRGRQVRLWGLVTSRFQDGQIIEDWAASDTSQVLRQLGLWRTLLLVARYLRRGGALTH
jgi:predicted ester cyclase